jgi:branched-chain amino acid transport system permease protein
VSAARIASFAAVVLAFAALPLAKPPAFFESFLYLIFFWIALATSWAILCGYSGYFSFGHGAFFGAGMYAMANLAVNLEWPFVWSLLGAGVAAAALGVGVGAVVFRVRRLRGELFALLTLAITFVLATIVLNTPLDGGPGILVRAAVMPRLYGGASATIYLYGLAIAATALAVSWIVQYSSLGRGLFAISDDEDVAEVLGVPTFRYKLAALGLSGFLAGIAGGVHAVFVSYVTVSETFSITVPLFVVLMSVLGGARTWFGPAIGAVLVTALTYAFVGGDWAVFGRAIIGITLVAAVLFLPHGITGFIASWRRPRAVPIDVPEQTTPRAPAARPASAEPLLVCEDVRLAFQGVKALDGVSLDVRQGEILGLVGPNGSGKSTLINVISGYYRRHGGRIALDGRDISVLPAHRIARSGVGRTYQIPRPFRRLTVLENVALYATFGTAGLDRAAAERSALHWLRFVGLGDRAHSLPLELNLHQRKFLELARALASGARLILLDEILAGLTPAEITNAIALIRRIQSDGATIIFVEHNMRAVQALADRVVVLNYGKVIAGGLPRDVMAHPEVVAAYLGQGHA